MVISNYTPRYKATEKNENAFSIRNLCHETSSSAISSDFPWSSKLLVFPFGQEILENVIYHEEFKIIQTLSLFPISSAELADNNKRARNFSCFC